MTLDDIKAIQTFLNLDNPCDAAIYACMVVVFYSVAHLGEFTVTVITKFDPTKHKVTHQNVTFFQDQRGSFLVMKFTLPITKCAPDGEDIQCALQKGCFSDPKAALQHHFLINSAPPDTHLFARKHPT